MIRYLFILFSIFLFSYANAQTDFSVTYDFANDMTPSIIGEGVSAVNAVAGGTKLSSIGIVDDGGTNAFKALISNNNTTNFQNTFIRCDIKPIDGYSIKATMVRVTQRSSKQGDASKSQTYLYRIGCTLNGLTPNPADVMQSTNNLIFYSSYSTTTFLPGVEFATASGSSFISAFVTPRGAATSNDEFDWYIDKIEVIGMAFKIFELPSFSIVYNFDYGSKLPEITKNAHLSASTISASSNAEGVTSMGLYWIRINSNANTIGYKLNGLMFDATPDLGYEVVIKNFEVVNAGSGEASFSRMNRIALYHDVSRSNTGVEIGREDFTSYSGRNVYGDSVQPMSFKTTQFNDSSVLSSRNYFTFSVNRTGSPAMQEYWTVDKIAVSGWCVPLGRGNLLKEIVNGQTLLLDAKVGNNVGQYDQNIYNSFYGLLLDAIDSLGSLTTSQQNIDYLALLVHQEVDDFPNKANSGSVVVTIDKNSGVALNEGFAGFNMRIADSPWTYNNTDFQAACKSMNPGFLRYFSGTSGDYFDMNTGMYELRRFEEVSDSPGSEGGEDGTADGYSVIPDLYKWVEGKGAHRFSDFNNLCGEMGTKTVVTWSGFFDSPSNAATFARFCKNNNIIVDCWQFCNEPNFFAFPRRYFWADGEDYAWKMKEIADSIKSVFPNATLALSYGWGFGSSDFASQIKKYQNKNGHYWNTASVHAYPTHRTSDITFNDGYLTANNALNGNTNSSYFSSMVTDSWSNANLLITEFGVWNTPLNNTLYSALYVAEYYMRMSQQPQAWMIGKHHIASSFSPKNTFKTEVMNAYNTQSEINLDTMAIGYTTSVEGYGHSIVNKAFKNSSFAYSTSNNNKEVVDKRGGGTIPAIYAAAYKGVNDCDYLLVTNKTAFFHDLKIVIGTDTLQKNVYVEYFSDADPSTSNIVLKSDTMAVGEINIEPFSLMRIEWLKDSIEVPAPLAPRIFSVVHNKNSISLKWWKREVAKKYTVKYGTSTGNYNQTLDVTTNNAEITGLSSGTKYYFVVTASNESGESDTSNEVSASVQIPDQPAINFVGEDNQRVTIHWESVPSANGYKVKVGTSSGNYAQTIDAKNVSGYVIRNLNNNSRYFITVAAYNGVGESRNALEIIATPSSMRPWSPYLVNASENTNGSITVNWTPSDSAYNANYNVYYCPTPWDESNYQLIAENVDGINYIDQISRPKGYNYYRVKAVNSKALSTFFSNIATVNKTVDGITSVAKIVDNSIKAFPNPAQNWIYLSNYFQGKPISYKIYNVLGELQLQGIGNKINISTCSTGLLVFHITDGNEYFKIKVLKQ